MIIEDSRTGQITGEWRSPFEQYVAEEEEETRRPEQWGEMPTYKEARESGVNPLMYGAAKLQQFLGRSQILPVAYSAIAARVAPPVPGLKGAAGAAGYSTGERMRKALRGEEMPVLPTKEEVKGVAKGATFDVALRTAGKLLRPQETLGEFKTFLTGKAEKAGVVPDPKPLLEAGDKYVKLNPLAKPTWEKVKSSISQMQDPRNFVEQMTIWGKEAYTTSGEVKEKASAELFNKVYRAGKQVMKSQMKNVTFVRSLEATLYSIGAIVEKALPYSIPAWLGYKGIQSLKGTGGGGQGFTPVY